MEQQYGKGSVDINKCVSEERYSLLQLLTSLLSALCRAAAAAVCAVYYESQMIVPWCYLVSTPHFAESCNVNRMLTFYVE